MENGMVREAVTPDMKQIGNEMINEKLTSQFLPD
jgi:arabinogalactan endo-1,4-beta-galactosidase